MKRSIWSLIFVVALPLAAQTVAPAGEEDPSAKQARAILDKTVQALGGQAYLNAPGFFYAGRASGFSKGELSAMQNVQVWFAGDKQRVERPDTPGWVTIITPEQGWEITYHGTTPLEPKILQSRQRQATFSLRKILTQWIRDQKTMYFYDGEKYAEARQCYSVTVIDPQNESATLLIEKGTYLPLKETWSGRDPDYHDKFNESVLWDKYRNVNGVQTPFIITRYHNDDMTGQTFVMQAKYLQLPEAVFTPDYKGNAPR